jgi:hypothetical protein
LRAKSEALALVAADPGNREWRFSLGGAYEMVGMVLASQGKLDEALDVYLKTVEITDSLNKANPDDVRSQRSFAVAVRDVGQVNEAKGDFPAAIAAYVRSVAIMQHVLKTNPDRISEQEFLAVSLRQLGNVYREAGTRQKRSRRFRMRLRCHVRWSMPIPGTTDGCPC